MTYRPTWQQSEEQGTIRLLALWLLLKASEQAASKSSRIGENSVQVKGAACGPPPAPSPARNTRWKATPAQACSGNFILSSKGNSRNPSRRRKHGVWRKSWNSSIGTLKRINGGKRRHAEATRMREIISKSLLPRGREAYRRAQKGVQMRKEALERSHPL